MGSLGVPRTSAIEHTPQSRDGVSDFFLPAFQANDGMFEHVSIGVGVGHEGHDIKTGGAAEWENGSSPSTTTGFRRWSTATRTGPACQVSGLPHDDLVLDCPTR
jgi:hypothetical protein